jgi:hypothetical protein
MLTKSGAGAQANSWMHAAHHAALRLALQELRGVCVLLL